MKLKNWEGCLSLIVRSSEPRNVGAVVNVVAYAGVVEYAEVGPLPAWTVQPENPERVFAWRRSKRGAENTGCQTHPYDPSCLATIPDAAIVPLLPYGSSTKETGITT